MTATLRAPANDILNRVAAEVGLQPVADPYGSSQQEFRQMTYLLNIAGEELAQLYDWEFLNRQHQISTLATDSGDYPLPADFLYIRNQTCWERTQNVPVYGPLSAQDWQFLLGRDLVTETIWPSFRIAGGVFKLFPFPPAEGLEIYFEYQSRNWCINSTAPTTTQDRVKTGADTPLFDRTLLSRYLKVKFLESKQLDTTKAQADLNQMFELLGAHDKGADILSMGRANRGYPYLDGFYSVPDSGYGR